MNKTNCPLNFQLISKRREEKCVQIYWNPKKKKEIVGENKQTNKQKKSMKIAIRRDYIRYFQPLNIFFTMQCLRAYTHITHNIHIWMCLLTVTFSHANFMLVIAASSSSTPLAQWTPQAFWMFCFETFMCTLSWLPRALSLIKNNIISLLFFPLVVDHSLIQFSLNACAPLLEQ